MSHNDVWNLLNYLKVANPLVVNGCTRSRKISNERLRRLKPDWLSKILQIENALITMRHFLLYSPKMPLE